MAWVRRLLSRNRVPAEPEPTGVSTEELGLRTLKQQYQHYNQIANPIEKERQLYKLLPLFLQNCTSLRKEELQTKFHEVCEFGENVARLLYRHVTKLLQSSRPTLSLLKFFSEEGDTDVETGLLMLKVIRVLSRGPEPVINAMMKANLAAILIRCLHNFLDLPQPPASPKASTPSKGAVAPNAGGAAGTAHVDPRHELERLLVDILKSLVHHLSAVEDMLQFGDLSLLFGAISTPCARHNKIWRRAAADTLLDLCRLNLNNDVIDFVHRKGCIGFCIRNIRQALDQPPGEVVEIFTTILDCLKASCDFSQVLIEDFSSGGGYKLVYDFCTRLEKKGTSQQSIEATRGIVKLLGDFVLHGFHSLKPTLTDGGPFQALEFTIPVPRGHLKTVRNKDAFLVLQGTFLSSQGSHLGICVLETILDIYRLDQANYFVLESLHTIPSFIDAMATKKDDVQDYVLKLVEFVVNDLNFVPIPEITNMGLLLDRRQYPKTMSRVLNSLLKLISYNAKYKAVFRDTGILAILINSLRSYAEELSAAGTEEEALPARAEVEQGALMTSGVHSPSLTLEDVQGAEEEYVFLLMECLRAVLADNKMNGQMFSEKGGTSCALELIAYKKPRRMALRLVTQILLLPDCAADFTALLGQLNARAQTAVVVKIEILNTVLGVFQLDSFKKTVFREVCGFHYLISVLACLYGSLSPRRGPPWIGVPRSDVLQLVKLVFCVLTTAMQDDLANRMFFDTNIRFDSFTAPLHLLGCFRADVEVFDGSSAVTLQKSRVHAFDQDILSLSSPSDVLTEHSFVHSAAEVFRFLRDMALGLSPTHSISLLAPQHKVTATSKYSSTHLVHPGALLCMVDLLPSVDIDEALFVGQGAGKMEAGGGKMEASEGKMEASEGKMEASEGKMEASEGKMMEASEGKMEASEGKMEASEGKMEANEGKMEADVMAGKVELLQVPAVKASMEQTQGSGRDDLLEMSYVETKKWCLFLQERVMTELYAIATYERNQQAMCQVGLPEKLLYRCSAVLANEAHPLNQCMERTFERLSYQALKPADFRNFLRLGNPLRCGLHLIRMEDLQKMADLPPEEASECVTDLRSRLPPMGGPLSYARMQSLVSMTTPRDTFVVEGSPSFVEFDLSIDGFGCLFVPNVFQQSFLPPHDGQIAGSPTSATGGGGGSGGGGGVSSMDRPFPPNTGLTFSTWICVCKLPQGDPHPLNLLTLSQSFYTKDDSDSHPVLRVALVSSEMKLVVSTEAHKHRGLLGGGEERTVMEGAEFSCRDMVQGSGWHHVAVVVEKSYRGKAKVSALIDGKKMGQDTINYIQSVNIPTPGGGVTPYVVNVHLGTYVSERHLSQVVYRMGPTFLCDEPQVPSTIQSIFKLGPFYWGSFQGSAMSDNVSFAAIRNGEAAGGSLIAEERIVFGLIASSPLQSTVKDMAGNKEYSAVDMLALAMELSVSDDDNSTPVLLFANTARHLSGPTRPIGAVMCGFSGVRAFEPQTLRQLLSAVGGTSVMLGLVAMANTVDGLYASMKALVCIVGNNETALKEMERTGGFQVLGMLLQSKAHLINTNILHLTYTFVGTVDSQHESAFIPHPNAFGDLLADLSIWKSCSEEVQKSLASHFHDLLTHSSDAASNSKVMVQVKMVNTILVRLHDYTMTRTMTKALCNVLNALFSHRTAANDDLRRLGQFMVSTLPLPREYSEVNIDLYAEVPAPQSRGTAGNKGNKGDNGKEETDDNTGDGGSTKDDAVSIKEDTTSIKGDTASIKEDTASTKGDTASTKGDTASIKGDTASTKGDTASTKGDTASTKGDTASTKGGMTHSSSTASFSHTPSAPSNLAKAIRHIVARDFLLDMLMSLSQTEHQEVDSKFAHLLCQVLGMDWLVLFLQPHLHIDTVTKALRLLCQLLRDHTIMQKFMAGELFGGWLHGMESLCPDMCVKFERSKFNPLRASNSTLLPGIPLLTQFLPKHPKCSRALLILFALMLGTPSTDVPPSGTVDVETMDTIFSLKATRGPVCYDAAFILLAVVKDMLHNDFLLGDGSAVQTSHPVLVVLKFFEKLYHKVSQFALFCQSQEVIEALAAILFPSVKPGMEESDILPDTQDDEYIVVTATDRSQDPEEQSNVHLLQSDNLAVFTVVRLLRSIAIDGMATTTLSQKDKSPPSCTVLENVLTAYPQDTSPKLQNTYQCMLMARISEHLASGHENVLVLLQQNLISGFQITNSLHGMVLFCSKLVDKLWQRAYDKPAMEVYTFLLHLLEQAKKQPSMPGAELQRCLNRTILYMVSEVPSSEQEQKALMDTLCNFSSQAANIFDENNNDVEFLRCLSYRLFQLAFADVSSPASSDPAHTQTPVHAASVSMMKSGANRLWGRMLDLKHQTLEVIFGVPLPTMSSPASVVPDILTKGMGGGGGVAPNPAFAKLQNCRDLMTSKLQDTWERYAACEGNEARAVGGTARKSIFTRLRGRVPSEREKSKNVVHLIQDYSDDVCPVLLQCAKRMEEAQLSKYQRNIDYKLRFAATQWARIELELTRERGLWGPERSSQLDKWTLDCVEGPSRMRKRLCMNDQFYVHYHYNPSRPLVTKSKHQRAMSKHSRLYYFRSLLCPHSVLLPLEDLQKSSAIENASSSKDLCNLLVPDADDSLAQALLKMIEPDDRITSRYQCGRLRGLDSRDGVLLLGETHFYVVEGVTLLSNGTIMDIQHAPEGSYEPVVPEHLKYSGSTVVEEPLSISCIKWPYKSICEIHKQRYLLRQCALEVFAEDGRNHFLVFHIGERDKVYNKFYQLAKSFLNEGSTTGTDPDQLPLGIISFITGERSLTQKWENGEITNFEYLMHLNKLSGRSYSDLMQYPVFPWILADYTSETLDLTNPKTFRDFSKPMGAQTEARLKQFLDRYKYFEDPTGENTPPYHYGTHYSSAMGVAGYMIRMEPFTQYFLKLQGGHFDLPDRLFHSIPDAWKSASQSNMADIKELVPEFFYMPEFLVNGNHFELGTKQSGEELSDVILPTWAKGDPHEFIRIHREALECDYVSAHLHEWIDLVFGYKQQGKEAIEAFNVFHHLFYEGSVDIDKIEDSVKKQSTIAFIHNFGQMPRQLFKRPHRQRKIVFVPTVASATSLSTDGTPTSGLESRKLSPFNKNLFQLMPSKDPALRIRGEVYQIVCSDKHTVAVEKNRVLLPPTYNRYFAWGYPDRSARVAVIEKDGEKVTSVYEQLQQGKILCATVAENNILLTAGDSTVVYVWEIITPGGLKEKGRLQLNLKHTLHGHTAPVTCLATSANYSIIVSGSEDRTCIVWDLTKEVFFVRELDGHPGTVTMLAINQMNGNIVTGTDSTLHLWTLNGTLLAELNIFPTGKSKFLCCAVSEMFDWDKDNVIVTGSSDGVVRMWSLEYEKEGAQTQKVRPQRSATATPSPLERMAGQDTPSPVSQKRERREGGGEEGGAKEVGGRRSSTDSESEVYFNATSEQGDGVDGGGDGSGQGTEKSSGEKDDKDTSAGKDTSAANVPVTSSSLALPVGQASVSAVGPSDSSTTSGVTIPPSGVATSPSRPSGGEVPSASVMPENPIEEARRKAEERKKAPKWIRKLSQVHSLTMHTAYERKDNDSPAGVTALCITRDHRRLIVGDANGRVYPWTVSESVGGMMEHWLRDEAVDSCMKCNKVFSFSERKHHCRNCGKIFCANCSSYWSEVEKLKIYKRVRVCVDCYEKAPSASAAVQRLDQHE